MFNLEELKSGRWNLDCAELINYHYFNIFTAVNTVLLKALEALYDMYKNVCYAAYYFLLAYTLDPVCFCHHCPPDTKLVFSNNYL